MPFQLFKDVETVLESIDAKKAIVSNAYNDYLEKLLKELGIKQYMDFWIAPRIAEIETYRKKMKPEPQMVEEALKKLGAENAVMVGDQFTDILAARKAGIDSIYIDRTGDKESKADYSVHNLGEVAEIVRSHS